METTNTEVTTNAKPQINLAARTAQANSTVKGYVIASMGVGLIPVAGIDLAALAAVQLKMLHGLSKVYNVPFSANVGKSLIASLVGGITTGAITLPVASWIKIIPIVGQFAGIMTLAVLGGAITYAVGKVFVQHFESGGTFLDFDPEKMRAYFAEQVQEGKKVAAELKSSSN